MAKTAQPQQLVDVIEEHFAELDFLWEQRQSILFDEQWTLVDLAALESRAEAHLDALRLTLPRALVFALPGLAAESTFAVFAAARVALESDTADARRAVLLALESARGPALDGLRHALRTSDVRPLESELAQLLCGADAELELALVDALGFQGRAVPALSERVLPDAEHAALAWRVRARGRKSVSADRVRAGLADPSGTVRRAALEAAATVASPDLLATCRAALARGGPADGEAIEFLGVVGDSSDVSALRDVVAKRGAHALAALAALGAAGRIDAIDTLFDALAVEKLAPEATRALVRITGVRRTPTFAVLADGTDALGVDDARRWWKRASDAFRREPCWQFGIAIGASGWPPRFDELPLPARRDVYLRASARRDAALVPHDFEQLASKQRLAR